MTLRRVARTIRRYPILMVIPYHVFRFFRPRYRIGVVAVIFNEAAQVLLVEHVFHARFPWGLPGGWVDRNESPDVAIQRELHEELELTIQIECVLGMGISVYKDLDIAFLCRPVSTVGQHSFELLDHQWYAVDHLPPLLPQHHEIIHLALEQYSEELHGTSAFSSL